MNDLTEHDVRRIVSEELGKLGLRGGIFNFLKFHMTPHAAPQRDYELVNKKYVDDLGFYISGGDLHLDLASGKTLVLDDPVYNDANIGGVALRAGVTSPPVTQWVDNLGANTGIYALGFAVNDEANGSIEIPHDYKEGTNITFHIHWGAVAAPSGTDYVKWTLTYTVQRDNTTFVPATATSVETAYDTQYETTRSDFTAITGTNFKIGDQFNFNIKRVAAVGDAFSGVAIPETIGFHYQCDTLGSRQIGTK